MLITTAQLIYYVDQRLVCEFLSDSDAGTPVDPSTLSTNQTLLALIEQASQDLISACFRARTYTINEIVSLAGDQIGGQLPVLVPGTTAAAQSPANLVPITTSGATIVPGIGEDLRKTVAALTWGMLLNRRKLARENWEKLAGDFPEAQAKLQQITLGERIWQVPLADAAGLPSVQQMGSATPGAIANNPGLFGNMALGYPYYQGPYGWPRGGPTGRW